MTTLDSIIAPKLILPAITLNTAANQTITKAQSGSLLLIPAIAANRIYTMPGLEAGLRYRVAVKTIPGFTATFTFSAAVVRGKWCAASGAAGLSITASTSVIFAAACVPGDFMDFYCDGTNWYCFGMAAATGTITAA